MSSQIHVRRAFQIRHGGASNARRGAILLWSVFVAFAVLSASVIASTLSMSAHRIAEANLVSTQAEYLALAGVEHAKQELFEALIDDVIPPAAGSVVLDGVTVEYTINQLHPGAMTENESGLNVQRSVWELEGSAQIDGVRQRSRKVVRGDVVPLFQFAMFYQGEMHFLYPAPMQIKGPVHCNSNVYLYTQQQLQFDTNHFHVAGQVYGQKKYPEWDVAYPWGPASSVNIRRWVDDPFDASIVSEFVALESQRELANLGIPSSGGMDSLFAGFDYDADGNLNGPDDMAPFAAESLSRWSPPAMYFGDETNYTLQTQDHGIEQVRTPEIADFDMYVPTDDGSESLAWNDTDQRFVVPTDPATATHSKSFYHENAGLAIITAADGSWSAFNGAADVTSSVSFAVTMTTMYDARQAEGSGGSIQVASIDLAALDAAGYFPVNGMLYVASEGSGPGTQVKGFELTNGSTLAGDLTVVSPDSIYIRGDYNTSDQKNASVMADAVNLLSNSWVNSKTPGSLPAASSTTYNVSILTGDTEATPSNFNGGPHNLPRFHEFWYGRTCTINGSMVCLGNSSKATGRFAVGGDYYYPPTRLWSFDPRLNDLSNLPPFTPSYVDVTDVVTW